MSFKFGNLWLDADEVPKLCRNSPDHTTIDTAACGLPTTKTSPQPPIPLLGTLALSLRQSVHHPLGVTPKLDLAHSSLAWNEQG